MIWELLGEVDHLRAELAVTRHAVDDWRDEYARLRAENARLLEERERWADTALIESERVADRSVTVAELRAREAAALAIVREVATEDTLAYEGDAGDDYRCVFCGGHFDWRDGYEHTVPMREQMDDIPRALIHAPDCPVTKARALLADEEH